MPIGGGKKIVLATSNGAAGNSYGLYVLTDGVVQPSAVDGVSEGNCPVGCNTGVSFVLNGDPVDGLTVNAKILLGFEVGDGQISYRPGLELTIAAGNGVIDANHEMLPEGVTGECGWADTITINADYTGGAGAQVIGDGTNGVAEVCFDNAGAARILVLTSIIDADGVAPLTRGF